MRTKTNIISIFLFVILLLINCRSQKPQQESTQKTVSQQPAKLDTTKADVFVVNFEKCQSTDLPDGWKTAMTGNGDPGNWEIITDETETGGSKVLAQTSMENYGYHFDIAVLQKPVFKDLHLSVKFKAIKGEEDQGGGPVWRYQDADNYYIARANPLESNFRIYKVANGKRKQLKSHNLPITSGQWHTITIEHIGAHVKCFYDGQLYLEVDDETFDNSGKIGVWTKADSYCFFDDLMVTTK